MENNPIIVSQADMLSAINRAEVDMQISTAKTFPRNIKNALDTMVTLATMDTETAEDCFYALRRGNGNDAQVIEGLSVRMAEIIASSWGNLRVQTRIIGNDGKTITAQAVCHDLETNYAISLEVKRRITDKSGRTYSEDMQVVTGNAASAIAYRNAVLKVVPKAVTKKVVELVKDVAMGKSLDLETTRQRMIDYYAKLGVSTEMLLQYVDKSSIIEMTPEDVVLLRATATAIKEGTTSVNETFIIPAQQRAKAAIAAKEATTAKEKVEAAKARSVGK